MGPGLYKAFMAIKSSNLSGFNCFKCDFIPSEEN